MRFQHLLEWNIDKTIDVYGIKALQKSKHDVNDKFANAKELFDWIASYDPSPTKKYSQWMARLYANDGIKRLEDIPARIAPELKRYYKLSLQKASGGKVVGLQSEHKDINKFKTISDFEYAMDQYKTDSSKKEQKSEEEEKLIQQGQAEVIYNKDGIKIVITKTYKANCYYGVNTKWCTTSEDDSLYFDQYNEDGPLYVIIDKKNNRRFQFHFESGQYMNEKDHAVNLVEFKKEYPEVIELFKDKFKKNIFKYLLLFDDAPESMKIEAINKNPADAMKVIKNPSEDLQLKALKKSGSVIGLIKNPSKEMQLMALSGWGLNIKYIKNPDIDVQKKAISTTGDAIRYIKNPSEEIQKLAIDKTVGSIGYIKDPSEEIQLYAMSKNPKVIARIKNPTEKVQEIAIRHDPKLIKYIENPTQEIQKLAMILRGY